jgi:hypothetical protein
LQPWESPPSVYSLATTGTVSGDGADVESRNLEISKFHPSPLDAIAEAERASAGK